VSELRLNSGRVRWREIEDELVVVDVPSSTYLSANQSAALLWSALARGTTRDALIEQLVAAFGLERERASEDVDAFLADLEQRDLLEHA
jgi:hypothetical protein